MLARAAVSERAERGWLETEHFRINLSTCHQLQFYQYNVRAVVRDRRRHSSFRVIDVLRQDADGGNSLQPLLIAYVGVAVTETTVVVARIASRA